MIRQPLRILPCVLLLCAASQNPMWSQPAPSSNRPLRIYVTASEKGDSSPIPALSQLKGAIDKQPAALTSLRSASADKMRFAVLVDASNSEVDQAESIREAALQLFQNLLEQGNEGYLLVFNEQITTSGKPLQLSEVRQALESVKPTGGTAISDAIAFAGQKILSKSGNPDTPRRAIFLITDGDDNASKIDLGDAEEIVLREGVAIFSLQTVTSKMPSNDARRAIRFLHFVSLDTGGQAFRPRNVAEGVPLLLKAIREQCVLDVVPAQPSDQKLHALSIKTSQKNVEIAAPRLIFLE